MSSNSDGRIELRFDTKIRSAVPGDVAFGLLLDCLLLFIAAFFRNFVVDETIFFRIFLN